MLDLKELERRLEAALEKETEQSLNAWLLSKSTLPIHACLGEGKVVSFKETSFTLKGILANDAKVSDENNCAEYNYAMAA
jgi:hypothetical protein